MTVSKNELFTMPHRINLILISTLEKCHDTVWLTQALIAELFQTTPQNITLHIKNVYEEGELLESATCKDFLQVRFEGSREVKHNKAGFK